MINILIATALCFAAVIYCGAGWQAFAVLFWLATIYHTIRAKLRPPEPDAPPQPVQEMTPEQKKWIFGDDYNS